MRLNVFPDKSGVGGTDGRPCGQTGAEIYEVTPETPSIDFTPVAIAEHKVPLFPKLQADLLPVLEVFPSATSALSQIWVTGRGEAGDWWPSDLTASTHDGLKLMGDVDNLGLEASTMKQPFNIGWYA